MFVSSPEQQLTCSRQWLEADIKQGINTSEVEGRRKHVGFNELVSASDAVSALNQTLIITVDHREGEHVPQGTQSMHPRAIANASTHPNSFCPTLPDPSSTVSPLHRHLQSYSRLMDKSSHGDCRSACCRSSRLY